MEQPGFEQRLESFVRLGKLLKQWSEDRPSRELEAVFSRAILENPWYDTPQLMLSLKGLAYFLKEDNLMQWAASVPAGYREPGRRATVALILPGNLPAVGFADVFYVLMGGHKALIKYSSRDKALLSFLLWQLENLEPTWEELIREAETPLRDFDAVVVTGSSDTARQFDFYFRQYPRIIRGHRQSAAVLTGEETAEELAGLALDMTAYYGLGCRSVCLLLTPPDYEFEALEEALRPYTSDMLSHHRFRNNYDYRKAVMLLARQPFRELGPFLLAPFSSLAVPVSMIHHHVYNDPGEVKSFCESHKNQFQIIVSRASWLSPVVAPGRAQFPAPWDYADNVDVPQFLASLNTM